MPYAERAPSLSNLSNHQGGRLTCPNDISVAITAKAWPLKQATAALLVSARSGVGEGAAPGHARALPRKGFVTRCDDKSHKNRHINGVPSLWWRQLGTRSSSMKCESTERLSAWGRLMVDGRQALSSRI